MSEESGFISCDHFFAISARFEIWWILRPLSCVFCKLSAFDHSVVSPKYFCMKNTLPDLRCVNPTSIENDLFEIEDGLQTGKRLC